MLTKSVVVLVTVGGLVSGRVAAQSVAQADVQIQSLTVMPARNLPTRTPARLAQAPGGPRGTPAPLPSLDALEIQVVVFSNNDDDAQNVRLNIFLPPESHPISIPAGCAPPPNAGSLNPYVTCALGAMFVNASRAVTLVISRPPSFVVPRVGVFAWSDTPDPSTANNHAEAVAP